MYSKVDKKWFRKEWKPKCLEKMLAYPCQGVSNHPGSHWCYSYSGSFIHSSPDGGLSMTPPGHKEWISPLEMRECYHIEHFSEEEVTDPEILLGLEDNKPPEKFASINHPI